MHQEGSNFTAWHQRTFNLRPPRWVTVAIPVLEAKPTPTAEPELVCTKMAEMTPSPSSAASFSVAHGHLRGEYDSVLLSTDLEPDDVIAIKLLSRKLSGLPMLVVVGEGPSDKRRIAARMLAKYGLSARIVQGMHSDQPYPTTQIEDAFDAVPGEQPPTVSGGSARAMSA